MSFLKKLFAPPSRDIVITDYASFWQWFSLNQEEFYSILRSRDNVESTLLSTLIPALHKVNPGFYCVCGIERDHYAELVISAEGNVKNFVFVEDFVSYAPEIPGWRITALKPPIGLDAVSTTMKGIDYNQHKIAFYPKPNLAYPDEISLVFVHTDYNKENAEQVENGTFIFLENAIGEMNLATMIDEIEISGEQEEADELIPLNKLLPYLKWRETEFVEKYRGGRYYTESDRYATFSGQDSKGRSSIGLMNTNLLQWDAKGSHPWMMTITINYSRNQTNGMPDRRTFQKMDQFERELCSLLLDSNGYLNVGRQTYNGIRTIYFACVEFRYASRIARLMIAEYKNEIEADYDICRDKYWITLERFSDAC